MLDDDLSPSAELKAIGSDSNFKYIDDSSTSQSETERNSQNSQKLAAEAAEHAEDCFAEDAGHHSAADKENYYSNASTLPRKSHVSSVPSYATAPRSMSVSSTLGSRGARKNRLKAGLYDSKVMGALCDDCRMVVERNRTNRERHFSPVINSLNKVSLVF